MNDKQKRLNLIIDKFEAEKLHNSLRVPTNLPSNYKFKRLKVLDEDKVINLTHTHEWISKGRETLDGEWVSWGVCIICNEKEM